MSFSLAGFQNELAYLYDQAVAAEESNQGAWAKVYTFIFGLISVDENGQSLLSRGYDINNNPIIVDRNGQQIDLNAGDIDIGNRYDSDFNPASGVDPAAWVFLRGVPDVNAGQGDYSAFIREYSKAQYLMRNDSGSIDDAALNVLVQKTSDTIAKYILQDILSLDQNGQPDDHNPSYDLLSAERIATFDASAAASVMFQGDNIGGWAGICIEVPFRLGKSWHGAVVIRPPETGTPEDMFDLPSHELRDLIRGFIWRDEHFNGMTIREIAKRDKRSDAFVGRMIRKTFEVA